MLTQKEALYYEEQLHPAFAGYLHDGTITERDALATIFQLLSKGMLDPVWQDRNMLKSLVGARRMRKGPRYPFEQLIIDKLFGSKNEITSAEIRDVVKRGEIREILKRNVKAITVFPLIREELKFTLGKHGKVNFSVNGNPVDTVEEATQFKKLLTRVLIPLFIGIGIFLLFLYWFIIQFGGTSNVNINNPTIQINGSFQGSPDGLLATAGIMVGVILLIFLAFTFTKKTVEYSFEDDVIPLAKRKYENLYEFLINHPLKPHRFTNEFLAFAIAFGLDTSWYKDFGLEKELKIDATSITTRY